MKKQDYEQLTLFPEDFPASHFPWLESKKVKKTTVTYGRKCSELSEKLSQVGYLVRTYLESCKLPGKQFVRTWSVRDTLSPYLILKLRLSVQNTDETGSSLWRTPDAHCDRGGVIRREDDNETRNGTANIAERPSCTPSFVADTESRKSGEQESRNRREGIGRGSEKVIDVADTDVCNPASQGFQDRANQEMGRSEQEPQPERPNRWAVEPRLGGMVDGPAYWLDGYWRVEPDIPRIATGIKNRVDRLKCLGNAVVPQQVYPILKAIARTGV